MVSKFNLVQNCKVQFSQFNLLYKKDSSRGTSLIGNSVRDFCRTKGFTRIFDGFFLKTKGFFPKVYEIFWE